MKKEVIAVLIFIFATALPLNAYSAVFINEVLANGVDDPDSEWVEVYNSDNTDASLTNWRILETSSSNFTFSAIVPAKGFIILAGDLESFNLAYPKVGLSRITIINITTSNFNLADTGGEVRLYNFSGSLADFMAYAQPSGKTFENVSIGRYPDGSQRLLNFSTLTPGAKNDAQAPKLNKWINPSGNNTRISALVNVSVNITDDASEVSSAIANFNGTNFSMSKSGDIWRFLWNTSLNIQKAYNLSISFNDSYGKSGISILFNISVDNSPFIIFFSPANLTQKIEENSTLRFRANASDPDDALLDSFWLVDGILFSVNSNEFSYTPSFNDNGTHAVNFTVKDSSNEASVVWKVAVANINRAPILGNISNKIVAKNTNLTFNISAFDVDSDTLIFSSNNSAISISKINDSLAAVSWKPTNLDLGDNHIEFSVSDGTATDSKVIIVTVNSNENAPPLIISTPKTNAKEGEPYKYDVDALDDDNDVIIYSVSTNASGMSIDSSTGVITFIPSSIGAFRVDVSATDLTDTVNQSYNLTVEKGNPLKISDVEIKIDGRKSGFSASNGRVRREAKPGSNVELKIKVKNYFSKEEDVNIEDIRAKATLEGIDDGNDIEDESNEFDLKPQRDKTAKFKFDIPLNVDEDSYDVSVEVEGDDEKGASYRADINLELEVKKEKHGLRLVKSGLIPNIISCSRLLSANYEVINIGQEDEKNAILEISNEELGLNFVQKGIFIREGTADNRFSKSVKFRFSGKIEKGAYPVTARVYLGDGKLQDAKTAELKVNECVKK